MNCHGNDSRICIVNSYHLKTVAHVKLIGGQEKSSCTNRTLTDSYYCFSYVNKTDKGTFFCGTHAANDFLQLANLRALPLFNPLTQAGNGGGNAGGGGNGNTQWDPTAKQLNDAINMLVVCWDTVPHGALADIQEQLLTYPNSKPFSSKIKAINTVISHDSQGRTLQDMIQDLRATNNIRQFNFNLLNTELSIINIPSNYG